MSGWVTQTETWIEQHAGVAAWVQAIGATLAVATAVVVPAMQARHARQQREADRRLRAKSLAIALYPDLLHIRAAYRRLHRLLQAQIAAGRPEGDAAAADSAGGTLAEQAGRFTIPITEALRAMVPEFYLLGEPIGPEVQKCIGRSMKYNEVLHSLSGPAGRLASPHLLRFIETGLREAETCVAVIEQAWGLSAQEADAFEEELAGARGTAPAPRSQTIRKETV